MNYYLYFLYIYTNKKNVCYRINTYYIFNLLTLRRSCPCPFELSDISVEVEGVCFFGLSHFLNFMSYDLYSRRAYIFILL